MQSDLNILEEALMKPEIIDQHRDQLIKDAIKVLKVICSIYTATDDLMHIYMGRFAKFCPRDSSVNILQQYIATRRLNIMVAEKIEKKFRETYDKVIIFMDLH